MLESGSSGLCGGRPAMDVPTANLDPLRAFPIGPEGAVSAVNRGLAQRVGSARSGRSDSVNCIAGSSVLNLA